MGCDGSNLVFRGGMIPFVVWLRRDGITLFPVWFEDIKSGIRHLTCGGHPSAYIFSFLLLSVSPFVRAHHYREFSTTGLGAERPSRQWPAGLGLGLAC